MKLILLRLTRRISDFNLICCEYEFELLFIQIFISSIVVILDAAQQQWMETLVFFGDFIF